MLIFDLQILQYSVNLSFLGQLFSNLISQFICYLGV